MLVCNNQDGSSFYIAFRHVTQGKNRRTICRIIRRLPDGSEVLRSVAMARCSRKDAYSKETGRLLSLERALHAFDKPFRTMAWAAYWNRGRVDEQEFINAYVNAEDLGHEEALALANALDAQAAITLMASVSGESNG